MARDSLDSGALAAALRSVQGLGSGAPSQIMPIIPGPYHPTAGTYEGGPRGMLAQRLSNVAGGGGGRQGGGGIGSGLNALGAGIQKGMEAWAAKRAQQQAFNDKIAAAPAKSVFGEPEKPAAFGAPGTAGNTGPARSPGAPYVPPPLSEAASDAPMFTQPNGGIAPITPLPPLPPARPYAPSPVAPSGPVPTFAQPGGGMGVMGSSIGSAGPSPSFLANSPLVQSAAAPPNPALGSIGPAGSLLPTLAAGIPAAPAAQPAQAETPETDSRLLNYLYGEAGNQGYAGQLAVANVMANRAAQNFRGYGTTMEAQATKGTGIFGSNSEFNGYKAAPESMKPQLQQAIANAGHDTTRGATFFANPSGAGSGPGVAWARNLNSNNSLKIGDHYFTDNINGVPFSGAVARNNAPPAFGAAAYAAMPPVAADQSGTFSHQFAQSAPNAQVVPGSPTNPNATQGIGVNGTPYDANGKYVGYVSSTDTSVPNAAAPAPAPIQAAPSATQISPGQAQTGPTYSDETWNNRPQYDYGGGAGTAMSAPVAPAPVAPVAPVPSINEGGAASVPVPPPPTIIPESPQGMNDQQLLALALMQNNQPNFGNFGLGFGGGDFA